MTSEAKYKANYGEGLKILSPAQMLQRLPIALAQVKVGNTSENLLNQIRQITYSLTVYCYHVTYKFHSLLKAGTISEVS